MKNWHRAIIALVFLALAALYAWQRWPIAIYDTTYDTSEMLPALVGTDEAAQEFTCYHNGLSGFKIRLAKSGRTEFDPYRWKLLDEDGKEAASGKIDPSESDYKGDYKIRFDEIKDSADKTYTFVIAADGVSSVDRSMTLYLSIPEKGAGTVTYNGEKQNGSLMLQGIERYFSFETFIMAVCLLLYLAFFIRVMGKLFN